MSSQDEPGAQPELRDVNLDIGQRIRRRRKHLNLSQSDLGKRIGLTFQQIQKYESGANRISAAMLLRIAKVLDVGIQYFFVNASCTSEITLVEAPDSGVLSAVIPLQTVTELERAFLHLKEQVTIVLD